MHPAASGDNHADEAARIRDAVAALRRRLPELEPDVLLRDLTTLRVGGPAAATARIRNSDDARRFLENARGTAVPAVWIGGGSNVLADDRGFCGLVATMAAAAVEIRGTTVRAQAGVAFDELIRTTLAAGLTGLEFASGIPGTLGGAVAGNAGCYGHEIGEFLREAVVLRPDGSLATLGPGDCAFAYRRTALRDRGEIVLEAVLELARGDLDAAAATRDAHLAARRERHPVDLPSAGSWFRNLPPAEPGGPRRAAGGLLERVGAKEMRVGDAGVFPRHANIIVNLGRATSADVLALAERMREAVRERFGVVLEAEVRYLPWIGADWGFRG